MNYGDQLHSCVRDTLESRAVSRDFIHKMQEMEDDEIVDQDKDKDDEQTPEEEIKNSRRPTMTMK